MDRRDFLRATAGVGVVGLAGCTSGGETPDDGDGAGDDGDDGTESDGGDDGVDVPEASVWLVDQRSDGETLTLATVETEADASLVVEDADGEDLGVDATFDAGTELEEREIELGESLAATQEITARLVHDEHGVLDDSSAQITVLEELDPEAVQVERGEVVRVDAAPDSGFEYPYYAYVPEDLHDDGGPLLVEPNNTGRTSDSEEEHRLSAVRTAESGFARRIVDELAVPLLVPTFPRPRSEPVDGDHYTHALDDDTMAIEDGPLARIDLQLLAMVDHLRQQLAAIGYLADEEVLLDGFSASGNFVNRFTALHPERVRSVTAGGINGTAILPEERHDGQELPFPIGVADLPELTGSEFDRDAWTDVAQYVYMGGEDDNDTIPYSDAWNPELREIALDVYGEDMQEDRMPFCESVYDDAGADAQFVVYDSVGHAIPQPVLDDVIAFHRANVDGGDFESIAPIDLDPSTPPLELSVAEQPTAGDTAVTVDVAVAEEYDARHDQVSVFVYDGDSTAYRDRINEPGSSYFRPGEAGTDSVALDEGNDGVPLESGQTITVALVDGSALVQVSTTVE